MPPNYTITITLLSTQKAESMTWRKFIFNWEVQEYFWKQAKKFLHIYGKCIATDCAMQTLRLIVYYSSNILWALEPLFYRWENRGSEEWKILDLS